MLISIIIPASNSENTIDRCVQSVINQKFKKFELLIVENNSTDLTWVKLLSLKGKYNKIRLFRNKKSGASRARNIGILKSRGKYIFFLDGHTCLNVLFNGWAYPSKLKNVGKCS